MKPEETGSIGRNGGPRPVEPAQSAPLGGELERLAALAARLIPEAGMLIHWRFGGDAGSALAPANPPWRSALERAAAAAENYRTLAPLTDAAVTANGGDALIETPHRADAEAPIAVAMRIAPAIAAGGNATVAVAAPARNRTDALRALAALTAETVAAAMRAAAAAESRDFWRAHAQEAAARLSAAEALAREREEQRKPIEAAATAAARLRPRNRYAGLGARFAAMGPFEAWIVALADGDAIRAVAAHGALMPAAALEDSSMLAACVRSGRPALRRRHAAGRTAPRQEDRLFARFKTYACVPFHGGAIALAANAAIEERALERTAALAARLDPILAKWRAEAESERLERLVRTLGMRLYGAVDAERARIARDLHDHQAQLLAAGRIALEAGPDEARGIFKQLEDALRLRVRELRPATLGRASLEEALRYELRRLADAGIRSRLMRPERIGALTRPVQQVCYQVAREALANVMRHAGATHVEIAVEKRGRTARLSILDNGKGIPEPSGRTGMGLSGLIERLELMGGRLKIESKRGATRLVAEIPEPV